MGIRRFTIKNIFELERSLFTWIFRAINIFTRLTEL